MGLCAHVRRPCSNQSTVAHWQVPLKSPITPEELEQYEFAGGSMKPKVAAAVSFVRQTGNPCGIGDLHDALDVVRGKAGTWIVPAQ